MSSHMSITSFAETSWLPSLCPCLQPFLLYRRTTSVDDRTPPATDDTTVTLRPMDRTPQLFHINTDDLIPPQVRTLIELYASANNVLRKRSAAEERMDNVSTTDGDDKDNTSDNNNDSNESTESAALMDNQTTEFDSNDITNAAEENTSFLPGTLIHFMKHHNTNNKDISRASSRRPTAKKSQINTHHIDDETSIYTTDDDDDHTVTPPTTTLTIDIGNSDNHNLNNKKNDELEEKTNDDTLHVAAPQRSPLFILIHNFFQPTPLSLDSSSPTTSLYSPTCSPLLCPSPSDFM